LLICDTAQTFPSFIYLIPVVMLFGVNDVAAIGAVVVFAMVPLARYTIEGLRGVPETLIEAADMSGRITLPCGGRQTSAARSASTEDDA